MEKPRNPKAIERWYGLFFAAGSIAVFCAGGYFDSGLLCCCGAGGMLMAFPVTFACLQDYEDERSKYREWRAAKVFEAEKPLDLLEEQFRELEERG